MEYRSALLIHRFSHIHTWISNSCSHLPHQPHQTGQKLLVMCYWMKTLPFQKSWRFVILGQFFITWGESRVQEVHRKIWVCLEQKFGSLSKVCFNNGMSLPIRSIYTWFSSGQLINSLWTVNIGIGPGYPTLRRTPLGSVRCSIAGSAPLN